ncbi:NUDIX domain-containing protein [Ferrimicrobium sp.]|uniref:NUDIX domain-containing protein n=1 Tax=Ferrimicrobium sp. TaxID=2926050 RepID=UPI00344DB1E8
MKEGESEMDAARRERREETGLPTVSVAGQVARVRGNSAWKATRLVGVAPFFLARVGDARVRPTCLTDDERATLLGCQWWSVEELREAAGPREPEELGDLLAAHVGRAWSPLLGQGGNAVMPDPRTRRGSGSPRASNEDSSIGSSCQLLFATGMRSRMTAPRWRTPMGNRNLRQLPPRFNRDDKDRSTVREMEEM